MSSRATAGPSGARLAAYVAVVVLGTAILVLAIRLVLGSWAPSAVVGVLSGGLVAAAYPIVVGRRGGP